jgi:G3E family GTPase
MTAFQPTPVTVVAGFLGAGKTTLLNALLKNANGRKLAVLVNDFGELDIDRSLIAEVTDNVQALTNGCICCSMQGELIEQIGSLATRQPQPAHILIECSGISEPARIIRTLGYPELRRVARLDSVTTIVDPTTLMYLEDDYAGLARAQIGAADLLILNKTDLVSRTELDAVRGQWLPKNRPIVESVASRIPSGLILDSDRELDESAQPISEIAPNHGFATWNITLPGVFRLKALRRALDHMPRGVFRIKGCVALGERPNELFWMHWVGGRTDFREVIKRNDLYGNQIVVIARQGDCVRDTLIDQLKDCLVDS